MECKCKTSWTPPKGSNIIKCPLCEYFNPTSVKKEIELHGLLLDIVNQYKKNILGEIRLYALISDLMPNLEEKYKSILKQSICDKVGFKLLQLEQESEAARLIKIENIKFRFKTGHVYEEKEADYIVDCFLFSLGWLTSIDKPQYQSKSTFDGKYIIAQQIEMAFTDGVLHKQESAQLFNSGKQLGLSDNEIAGVINAKIKDLKFKPDGEIDKTLSSKEQICSHNWSIVTQDSSQNKKIIISCPKCEKDSRIPVDKHIKFNCPKCNKLIEVDKGFIVYNKAV